MKYALPAFLAILLTLASSVGCDAQWKVKGNVNQTTEYESEGNASITPHKKGESNEPTSKTKMDGVVKTGGDSSVQHQIDN